MYSIENNPEKGTVRTCFSDDVTADEMKRFRQEVEALPPLPPGFKVLADFSQLASMELECVPEIRATMEILRKRGISKVIRVFPEPQKDIGFNILSYFHYGPEVDVQTYETLSEALEALAA